MGRFEYDYSGVGEWMRTSPELSVELLKVTDRAVAFAQSIAPIGDPAAGDKHPGHYRDSIEREGPFVTDRISYRVAANADYAEEVEDRHHVLEKTIKAFNEPKGA